MTRWFPLLALALVACSSDPTPGLGTRPDAGDDVVADTGSDTTSSADARATDSGPDVAPDAGSDIGADVALAGCAALPPAACMADETCTLNGGCVDAMPNDPPYEFLESGVWVGTARSEGEKGFPIGDTAATLSLFRSNGRDVRGLLALPDYGVTHSVWGGVGPTGEIGIYLTPPVCADDLVCNVGFAPAYDAGGLATDVALDITSVLTDAAVIDFRTFVSLRLTPSDGFKPVNPVAIRTDALVASWLGDMVAVDAAGDILTLFCDFGIDFDRLEYSFRTFSCAEEATAGEPVPRIMSADSTSIAYANGFGWFAVGPLDDDLVFAGRVSTEGPWEGVIAQRGDVWNAGDPVDPATIPIESLRGTFKFYGRPLN